MTFTPLNPVAGIKSIVRLAFGANPDADPATWTWTDVSAYVRSDVTIRKGRADFASTADPTQITFDLENTDGRFTPGNPASPYWPNVVRNVPCQVLLTGFGDPLVAPYERGTGFVNGWPLTPTVGVIVVRSSIVASGKLRRLGIRRKPLKSPVYRAISSRTPIAYWSLEDGNESGSAGSAVGGPAMSQSGAITYSDAGPRGSRSLPNFDNTGQLTGKISGASSASFELDFVFRNDETNTSLPSYVGYLEVYTTTMRFSIVQDMVPGFEDLTIFTPTGAFELVGPIAPDGTWHSCQLVLTQSGSDVKVYAYVDGVAPVGPATLTGVTLGTFITARAPARTTMDSIGGSYIASTKVHLGHLAVYSPATIVPANQAAFAAAVSGNTGETAAAREARICAEQGIRITTTTGSLGTVQPVGPQEIATFADIAHSAESADLGFLHDGGPNGDLAYRAFNTRYNAAVALALNYNAGHLGDSFAGTFDDQRLVNDSTVSRASGSSAEYADGSAVVEGDYDEGPTLNVAADSQLAPLAQARVAMGVYPAMRFSVIDLDMVRSPALAQQIVALTLGGRVTVSGLPYPLYPPGGVDQFVEGTLEVLGADKWKLALTCSPASLARVAVVQDATNPWLVDAGSSALNAGINATVVSVAIKTTSGPLWSTSGADYPVYAYVDGEEIQIIAMAGGASPQTATVVRSVNGVVKSHSANAVVSLYRPAVIAL